MSRAVLIAAFVLASIPLSRAAYEAAQCGQCATAALRDRWYATGLPNYPKDDFPFGDSCLYITQYSRSVKQCSSMCLEMTFPLDGQAQVVRGCYDDFFQGYDKPVKTDSPQCEYTLGTGMTTVGTSFNTTNPVYGVRTCTFKNITDTSEEACNTKFKTDPAGGNTIGSLGGNGADLVFCKKTANTKRCRSCLRFGNQGTCHHNTKTTCADGSYCTKITGKIGKNEIEYRGCAPVNPYGVAGDSSTCTYIEDKVEIPLSYASGYNEAFKGQRCFCNDKDECNPAAGLQYSLVSIVTLLGLATTLSPFF